MLQQAATGCTWGKMLARRTIIPVAPKRQKTSKHSPAFVNHSLHHLSELQKPKSILASQCLKNDRVDTRRTSHSTTICTAIYSRCTGKRLVGRGARGSIQRRLEGRREGHRGRIESTTHNLRGTCTHRQGRRNERASRGSNSPGRLRVFGHHRLVERSKRGHE